MNQECQYRGIFNILIVIGWISKGVYLVSLYMNKEGGSAEDFCKLWLLQYVVPIYEYMKSELRDLHLMGVWEFGKAHCKSNYFGQKSCMNQWG